MRVLVTGAGGMLGLDVLGALARAGHEVVGLARADLDISDRSGVRSVVGGVGPDVVINCAAFTKVDVAEADPEAAMLVNGVGPGVLAAAAEAVGAWVVHVSTDYVFDGLKTSGPYVESDVTGPRSVYGQSKLAGERAVAEAAPGSHTIVRSSWLFGLGGPCFPATILRAAQVRSELTVVADQVGSPTFTPHLAEALIDLALSRDVVGVAHVTAGGQCSWWDFASALVDAGREQIPDADWASVLPCSTEEYPLPAPRPAFSVLRSERVGVPVLADWRVGLGQYMAGWVQSGRAERRVGS